MKSNLRYLYVLGLFTLFISACNMPASNAPTESGAGVLYTAAAQTIEAQLTQVNQPPVGTQLPAGTQALQPPLIPTSTSLLPATAAATAILPTVTPLPSATPQPCDLVKFVKDVTYPDNTTLAPGEVFTKTWRLQNAGTCGWTTDYDLVFAGGDRMDAPQSVSLPGGVAPGQTVDLSVRLIAPDSGGTYRGDWKLRNASGVLFGLVDGGKPFWVQVKVKVATGLLFDFLVRADEADWVSSISGEAGVALTFGGDDNDPEGVAKIKDSVKLETGATSGKILLMFPKHDADGVISGLYPAYKVQKGDHFKARLGFMIPEGEADCGSGKVKFQVTYRDGDDLNLLQEWEKDCDGKFLPVDIDLSSLKGKTVQFAFVVMADGDFTDDWAIWNSPRIEH